MFLNVNSSPFYRYFSLKLNPGDIQKNLSALEQKWSKILPSAPFEYHFMDDALKQVYTNELQLKKAAYIATVLAVLIVMLGVLGLISISIQKRTKEIGIRKVLGASIPSISKLFLKDFIGVVIVAGIVACPLAYLMMKTWLNDYAYRITISLIPFVLSISFLTGLTAFLIITQTIRAALINPVKSIRANE